MGRGAHAVIGALALASCLGMLTATAVAGEDARAGRLLGPGVNLRADLGLVFSETGIEPVHASGTKTPVDRTEARHEAEYTFSSLAVPLDLSLELHPYFRVTGRAGYLASWLSAEWWADSVFVAPGDPNEQAETARLEPGFLLGIGAEGIYPLETFRFRIGYFLDWGRAALDDQRFFQTSVAGDYTFLAHRFTGSVGTRFRFLTPYLGVGGLLSFVNMELHEKLPAGSSATAGSWHLRYREALAFFLIVGVDAEVGEGVAGLRFRFLGEWGVEFSLGVRL